tara:strand:- start:590 stop:1273 length:684 start_codon:yes stop_codon:yes gene_type:complete
MQFNHITKIAKLFYQVIYNNKFTIWTLRKPFNTWILQNIINPKKELKDASIWINEEVNKTEWYSSISRENDKDFLNYILRTSHPDDYILDVCCNQGRFLKALKRNNYTNLSGFDIMKPAIDNLKNSEEYKQGGIHAENCLAQDYLSKAKKNSYDYAITMGATIENIHPSFPLFKVLYNITRKGFIFVINENAQLYPRFYRHLIKSAGFTKKKIICQTPNRTLLHYEK